MFDSHLFITICTGLFIRNHKVYPIKRIIAIVDNTVGISIDFM